MRVLVTGAAGFIGSAVCRQAAAAGHEVFGLIRPDGDRQRLAEPIPGLELLEADLFHASEVQRALARARPDLCLHLGWYAVPGKYLESPINLDCVQSSLRLLQQLHEVGCSRTVLSGTCFEYDLARGYLSEATPASPTSLYAASKHALFLMARRLQQNLGRSFGWGRVFYLYGPRESPGRLVPVVIRRLLAGEECLLPSGEQVRDYAHVSDVAAGLLALANSDVQGAVNIATGVPVTLAEVASEIAEQLDRVDLLKLGAVPPRPGDPSFICADTSIARERLGWRHRFSLQDGIADTVAWWRAQ